MEKQLFYTIEKEASEDVQYMTAIKYLLDKNRTLTELLKNEIEKNKKLETRNFFLENRSRNIEKKLQKENEKTLLSHQKNNNKSVISNVNFNKSILKNKTAYDFRDIVQPTDKSQIGEDFFMVDCEKSNWTDKIENSTKRYEDINSIY